MSVDKIPMQEKNEEALEDITDIDRKMIKLAKLKKWSWVFESILTHLFEKLQLDW